MNLKSHGIVILSKAKTLMMSKCYKFETLRLTPQNDIVGQTLEPISKFHLFTIGPLVVIPAPHQVRGKLRRESSFSGPFWMPAFASMTVFPREANFEIGSINQLSSIDRAPYPMPPMFHICGIGVWSFMMETTAPGGYQTGSCD